MNVKDVASQSSLLQEMVRVKKIRFKDIEEKKQAPKGALVRRTNFEDFKAVYEGCVSRKPSLSLSKEPHDLRKTRSGSLYRYFRAKKEARHVKTVNIELPVHYGADCAVQFIENKIKPKRASRSPRVPRGVLKQPEKSKSRERNRSIENKPKKSVTIVETAKVFQENTQKQQESVTDIVDRQLKEIQAQLKARKDRIHKSLPKLPVPKSLRKKYGNEKIMNTLASIKGKLQKMQEKYFNAPKVQYKNTSDCFTQSGNLEVLFENQKYPEVGTGDAEPKSNCERIPVSSYVLNDPKMQERIKEMNEMFPEFPKIEDTIRQIETHLEAIVNLNGDAAPQETDVTTAKPMEIKVEDGIDIEHAWNGGNLNEILSTINEKHLVKVTLTDEILKDQAAVKERKLRTIRKQIDEVEEFCDRLSEFANSEEVDLDSVASELTAITEETETYRDNHHGGGSIVNEPKPSHPESTAVQIENPDLQKSIKKSHYLSKEFKDMSGYVSSPTIKIFSENRTSFWKDRLKEAKRQNEDISVESVTKMIDTLKFTLENSIYEPVT